MCDINRIIVFNHSYVLKHDLRRTYIFTSDKYNESKYNLISQQWISVIHPIYAMLLSLASFPVRVEQYIKEISSFLDITYEESYYLVDSFLQKGTMPFYSNFGGMISQFPINILIDSDKAIAPSRLYTPENFKYDYIDGKTERALYAPNTVVLMPNSNCTTNCIYCYADRRVSCTLNMELIEKIIFQCKELNVSRVTLTGGDIFAYKYWRELLACMSNNGFEIGLLSTKTPISYEDAFWLKRYKVNLQFSLDSINSNVLFSMIGMDEDYLKRVENCFNILESVGLSIKVATVLTSINSDINQLYELFEFLSKFKNISLWEIRLAMKSLYSKKDFNSLKLSINELQDIDNKIKLIKDKAKFKISWSTSKTDNYFKSKEGSRSFLGARCSANYSNIMILPDGKVTICEQLYWNPKYIIGDISVQSIVEVWNSERALQLAFPKREDFRDISVCKECKIFDECYAYPNRCIVDVLKGYGQENDDFPDPRCVKAPQFKYELRTI